MSKIMGNITAIREQYESHYGEKVSDLPDVNAYYLCKEEEYAKIRAKGVISPAHRPRADWLMNEVSLPRIRFCPEGTPWDPNNYGQLRKPFQSVDYLIGKADEVFLFPRKRWEFDAKVIWEFPSRWFNLDVYGFIFEAEELFDLYPDAVVAPDLIQGYEVVMRLIAQCITESDFAYLSTGELYYAMRGLAREFYFAQRDIRFHEVDVGIEEFRDKESPDLPLLPKKPRKPMDFDKMSDIVVAMFSYATSGSCPMWKSEKYSEDEIKTALRTFRYVCRKHQRQHRLKGQDAADYLRINGCDSDSAPELRIPGEVSISDAVCFMEKNRLKKGDK